MRALSCGERAILQQDGPEDDPGPKVLRSSTHTARKPHACDGCDHGGNIRPGERYDLVVSLSDEGGQFELHRYCKGACRGEPHIPPRSEAPLTDAARKAVAENPWGPF